jgi:diguanylate cyclase (GGDEF)-like protein
MSEMEFAIICFQSLNIICLYVVLCYIRKHKSQKLTGFQDLALMTFSFLGMAVIFDLALLRNFENHLISLFALGTGIFFLAQGFYVRCALALFGYSQEKYRKASRLFLIVPVLLICAAAVQPALFFLEGEQVIYATPFYWAAFVYLALVYIVLLIGAIRTQNSYALNNKRQLLLFTILPALFQAACMVFETSFPARRFSAAACTGFLLPGSIIYAYWWYFTSSRRVVAEDTSEMYVVFDVFGVCADSNPACRRFFAELCGDREPGVSQEPVSLRILSGVTGIPVTELLTLQSRNFQITRGGGEQKFYQIDRFVVQMPQLNQINGNGFWIRDVTLYKEREQGLANLIDKDPLTNLYSRRYFFSFMNQLKSNTLQGGKPMALLLFDIDFLKRINDAYGHLAGDAALQMVAKRSVLCLRPGDIVCRLGGEEFIALLSGITEKGAKQIASRILRAISSKEVELPSGDKVRITVSIGGCLFAVSPELNISDLLREADEKLYLAKSHNRNRAVF